MEEHTRKIYRNYLLSKKQDTRGHLENAAGDFHSSDYPRGFSSNFVAKYTLLDITAIDILFCSERTNFR